MLYSNLLKSYSFVCNPEETRIINSNELAAQKLQKIASTMQQTPEQYSDGFAGGFSEGLNAEQITALLGEGDTDTEEVPSVMKAQPVYDGPTPEELIEQARAEIEEMRAHILDEAAAEAQQMRQAAYEEGKDQGYQDGYQNGIQKCKAKEQELERQRLRQAEDYDDMIQQLEPLFVEKITGIYEQLIGCSLKNYEQVVTYLLSVALQNIDGSRDFIIHVSKKDYSYVSEQREKLMSFVGSGNSTLQIIDDITLKVGECYIETSGGIFDCGIGTQLEELGKELRLLSYE